GRQPLCGAGWRLAIFLIGSIFPDRLFRYARKIPSCERQRSLRSSQRKSRIWRKSMTNLTSKEVRLKARPVGMPKDSDFEVATADVRQPGDAEVLVRNI